MKGDYGRLINLRRVKRFRVGSKESLRKRCFIFSTQTWDVGVIKYTHTPTHKHPYKHTHTLFSRMCSYSNCIHSASLSIPLCFLSFCVKSSSVPVAGSTCHPAVIIFTHSGKWPSATLRNILIREQLEQICQKQAMWASTAIAPCTGLLLVSKGVEACKHPMFAPQGIYQPWTGIILTNILWFFQQRSMQFFHPDATVTPYWMRSAPQLFK